MLRVNENIHILMSVLNANGRKWAINRQVVSLSFWTYLSTIYITRSTSGLLCVTNVLNPTSPKKISLELMETVYLEYST